MRKALAGVLGACALVVVGSASSATTFTDRAGDQNPAPDITSVTLAERVAGTVELRVTVANFPMLLPASSWFNVWLDLDSNPDTGGLGDEALVRYAADGTIAFHLWDGTQLVERDATGFAGTYEAGVLTLAMPSSELGGTTAFGVLVVGARSQNLSVATEFIASDFAPDAGRSAWAGPAEVTFADPSADHDEAPDLTSVRVTDAKDGWVRFAIATPNRATLPSTAVLVLNIDTDNRRGTGEGGADVVVAMGDGDVVLQRWNAAREEWARDTAPTQVRARNARGVVTVEVHRSELGDPRRFGFSVAALDVNQEAQVIVAADVAPEGGRYWRYTLANPVAMRLIMGKVTGTPVRPRAGERFTIRTPVTRSDTKRAIGSGRVTCNVRASEKRVPASGRIRSGAGQCTLVVPAVATSISGSMTVRSAGKSATVRFRFPVR